MSSSKVLQALPVARMIQKVDLVKFNAINQNGCFVDFMNVRVLEFETFNVASNAANQLNNALAPVLVSAKSSLENRITNILNA